MKKIIVFVLYKKEASRIEDTIRQFGYTVAGLHGDLSQDQRLAALSSFKEGRNLILVATDVAARGLDIPNVELVVNYTFPLTIEDYVHRIGRTGSHAMHSFRDIPGLTMILLLLGRGGKSGRAVTFFSGENHERALAGELARVVREGGYEAKELNEKFPMTVKKKQHAAYGSFFREETAMPAAQKIRF
jgi:ATP-dependent RNA helicase DBP3